MKKALNIALLIVLGMNVFAQQKNLTIKGQVTDRQGKPLAFVQVFVNQTTLSTETNTNGEYSLFVPLRKDKYNLHFKLLGYLTRKVSLTAEKAGVENLNIVLEQNTTELAEIAVTDEHTRNTSLVRIDRISIEKMPSVGLASVESVIKTLPGVRSSNELSSQYTVRGGNYDENLVYLNGVEVFRPMLLRSGQQEGLSFVNPDMVSAVYFSAGGFEAKYGGKMSSVLDVTYRKPKPFAASASASLLGATAHIETASQKIGFMTGVRYKTSDYILASLETDGDYKPNFLDIQTFFYYQIHPKLNWQLLSGMVSNHYNFIPSDRTTDFGTIQDAVSIYIDFEGQEKDKFQSYTVASVVNYMPSNKTRMQLTNAYYSAYEQENFDIQGRYLLNELDKQIGSASLGDSLMNLGIGAYLEHARNNLYLQVFQSALNFQAESQNHKLDAGVKVSRKYLDARMHEWRLLDSAGYVIPNHGETLQLQSTRIGNNNTGYNELSAYVQHKTDIRTAHNRISLIAGLRTNYSALNREFNWEPRAIVALRPAWRKDVLFRIAAGLYHQYPFYKEFVDISGNFNTHIQSQKAAHFVFGFDQTTVWWGRPFKINADIYYKLLADLIPYEIDNIRIKYHPQLRAYGYAAGIDFRIFGQFVEGVDSWVSFSVLKTEQDIQNDEAGFFPRPSDQRLSASLFFQDYLPGYQNFKMHMTLFHASGMPFGPPQTNLALHTLRMPAYNRVDLGLSANVLHKKKTDKAIKSIWIGLEAYNLLGFNNTVSYLWLTVVPNSATGTDVYNQYAVPNRLTARRLNLKLNLKF